MAFADILEEMWEIEVFGRARGVRNCDFDCIFEFSMYAALLIIFAFADIYKDLQL